MERRRPLPRASRVSALGARPPPSGRRSLRRWKAQRSRASSAHRSRRCTETARPAAERLGLRVETDARLIEIAHGTWEGRLREEIAANDPLRYRAWRDDPAHVAIRERRDDRSGARPLARVCRGAAARRADAGRHPRRGRARRARRRDGARAATFWNGRVENGALRGVRGRGARWRLLDESVAAHLGALRAPTDGQAL